MKKIYEHQITNGDHAEAISVETDAKSVRIAVSDIEDMDSEDQTEHITSINLSLEGLAVLIEALLKSINEDSHAVLKLTSSQLKVLIYSLELALDAHDGEIDPAAKPYDLLEALNIEFVALCERDNQVNKAS